jgi:hypothetical protein
MALLLFAIGAYVAIESGNFADRAAQLPRLLSFVLVVAAVIILVPNLSPQTGRMRAKIYPFADIPWRLWLGIVAALVLLGVGAGIIGFYESAFLFLAATTWMMAPGPPLGRRRIMAALAFAAGFSTFLYLTFSWFLRIPTPPGILI